MPRSLVGLALGTVAYYVVAATLDGVRLGPVIGTIPTGLPTPSYLPRFLDVLTGRAGVGTDVLWSLAAPAATLAVLGGRGHPAILARLLWNIGRELSARLRATTLQALSLEGSMD